MKGITLVEILLTVLITSFIVAAIYGTLTTGNLTYLTDMGMLDLQQQARQGMDRMLRYIRETSGANITSIVQDPPSITFKLNNIFTGNVSTSITYSLDQTNHIINFNSTPAIPGYNIPKIATGITSLSFFCCPGGVNCGTSCDASTTVVQIQIVANSTVMNKPLAFNLTEKVRLRNGN